MLTKGAIGNLVNRYRAVLKKCNLINTFGSLAVASMLVLGGAGVAGAEITTIGKETPSYTVTGEEKNTNFSYVYNSEFEIIGGGKDLTITTESNAAGINASSGADLSISGVNTLNLFGAADNDMWTGNNAIIAQGDSSIVLEAGTINVGSVEKQSSYTTGMTTIGGNVRVEAGDVNIYNDGNAIMAQSTGAMDGELTVNADNITVVSSGNSVYADTWTKTADTSAAITLNAEGKISVTCTGATGSAVKANSFDYGGGTNTIVVNGKEGVTLAAGKYGVEAAYAIDSPNTTDKQQPFNANFDITAENGSIDISGDTGAISFNLGNNGSVMANIAAEDTVSISSKNGFGVSALDSDLTISAANVEIKGATNAIEMMRDSSLTISASESATIDGNIVMKGGHFEVAEDAKLAVTGKTSVYNNVKNGREINLGAFTAEGGLVVDSKEIRSDADIDNYIWDISINGGDLNVTGIGGRSSSAVFFMNDRNTNVTLDSLTIDNANGTGLVMWNSDATLSIKEIDINTSAAGIHLNEAKADEMPKVTMNDVEKLKVHSDNNVALRVSNNQQLEINAASTGAAIEATSDGWYALIVDTPNDSLVINNAGGTNTFTTNADGYSAVYTDGLVELNAKDNTITGGVEVDSNGTLVLNASNANTITNDIANAGTISLLGGTTNFGGDITEDGVLSIADKATLALAADKDAVTIDNVVTNAGTISVADAAVFNKTIESKDGIINLADGAKLTVNADKKSGAILGDFTISGNGDVTLKNSAKNGHVLSSTTGWDYTNDKGKAGGVDVNITANSLTIDSEGYGIQNIAGKHTITANTVDITASNGGHAIQVQGQPNSEVTVNFGDGGFTATKEKVADDDGHALYVLDSSDKSTSKLTVKSIEGTAGDAVITGDTRAAVAVLGNNAEASISAGGDVTIESSISDEWTKSRKSAVVYVTGGKLDIASGGILTIKDNDGTADTAIGIAKGGEVTLKGSTINVVGDIRTITPTSDETDSWKKNDKGDWKWNAAYGSDADQKPGTAYPDVENVNAHAGKLILADGTLNVIDGTVSGFTGSFAQEGGTAALTTDNGFFGGNVNVTAGLLKYGDIDLSEAPTATATLAVGDALELNNGQVVSVGTPAPGSVSTIAGGSALNVHADGLLIVDIDASVSGDTFTAESGSKIHVVDARSGVDIMNFKNDIDTSVVTVSASRLQNITIDKDGFITVEANTESALLQNAIPTEALISIAENGGDTQSADMGMQFLSRAADGVKYAFTEDESIATINEVSRAAVTAGVQNTSLRIADAASNTVLDHLSLAQHDGSKAIHADGADFWAAPMYGNLYTSGMNVAGNSVRGQFGGLALGADLEAGQFLGGKFRLGAAINGGGGQSETKGTATSTQNDYDFGGLNFYAGWNSGALNVIASVGYGFGNHEVEMGLPSGMGMGTAKADINTTVFTADLRAEYQLKTSWMDVLPHVGIRYTALKTDAHDLSVNGSVLNSVASDTQNIVQFPIGVTLSKDFAFADWNVKPMVDMSVIPAAGDKEASTKVNFAGLDAWDSVNTRIMDSTSLAGTIGVQAEKGNMTFGLNYGVQASSNETDQNVQVKFGWKF